MVDLAGKTVLVTGASKGIGAAIAAKLGVAGANVIAHYGSDLAGAAAITEKIGAERSCVIGADLSDRAAVDDLWDQAVAWRGSVDVLVNNAAVMRLEGGIADTSEAWDRVWEEAFEVNVMAPARLLRHAVNHYLSRGGGTIVTVSSWAAQRGMTNPNGIAYAATKSAIAAATKTVARAYAKENILCYVVSPGVVRTRLSEESAATLGGEAAVTAGLAMGEWVPPEEIAELVAFLATGKCRHMTGATLDVNGASYVR